MSWPYRTVECEALVGRAAGACRAWLTQERFCQCIVTCNIRRHQLGCRPDRRRTVAQGGLLMEFSISRDHDAIILIRAIATDVAKTSCVGRSSGSPAPPRPAVKKVTRVPFLIGMCATLVIDLGSSPALPPSRNRTRHRSLRTAPRRPRRALPRESQVAVLKRFAVRPFHCMRSLNGRARTVCSLTGH